MALLEFEAQLAEERLASIRAASRVIAWRMVLPLNLLSWGVDLYCFPELARVSLGLRAWGVSNVVVADWLVRRSRSLRHAQATALLLPFGISAPATVQIFLAGGATSPLYANLLLVAVGGLAFLPWTPGFQIAAAAVIFAPYLAAALATVSGPADVRALALHGIFIVGTVLISLLIRSFDERMRRRELQHRIDLWRTSVTDALTALHNRRFFFERLAVEWKRAQREKTDLSLILLDVDHFKQVNDRHGHPAGDAVLAAVGGVLRETCRATDTTARYGGEEFAALLPSTAADSARVLGERLRTRVEALEVRAPEPLQVTISAGIVSAPAHAASPEELVKRADEALYRAKQAGRNRCEVCGG